MGPVSFQYFYGGSMLISISQIGPTWTCCGKYNTLMSCPIKVVFHKVISYYNYPNLKLQDKNIEYF